MNPNVAATEAREWIDRFQKATTLAGQSHAGQSDSAPAGMSEHLDEMLSSLRDAPGDVRKDVIEALKSRSDQSALDALSRLAKWERQSQLRITILQAIAAVELPGRVDALMSIAQKDINEEVRAEAIRQLGNLARSSSPAVAVRTRGAPWSRAGTRTRGETASRSLGLSSETRAILNFLDQTRFRDPSTVVRETADETLGQLD